MKKLVSYNIGILITLCAAFMIAYYFLLQDNCFHSSISSIIASTHHVEGKEHLLILGLLPIYIASMIFGSAILGIYLGKVLQRFAIEVVKIK